MPMYRLKLGIGSVTGVKPIVLSRNAAYQRGHQLCLHRFQIYIPSMRFFVMQTKTHAHQPSLPCTHAEASPGSNTVSAFFSFHTTEPKFGDFRSLDCRL